MFWQGEGLSLHFSGIHRYAWGPPRRLWVPYVIPRPGVPRHMKHSIDYIWLFLCMWIMAREATKVIVNAYFLVKTPLWNRTLFGVCVEIVGALGLCIKKVYICGPFCLKPYTYKESVTWRAFCKDTILCIFKKISLLQWNLYVCSTVRPWNFLISIKAEHLGPVISW